jgi:hypothetical protein
MVTRFLKLAYASLPGILDFSIIVQDICQAEVSLCHK